MPEPLQSKTPRRGQERYVAPPDETPLQATDSLDETAPPASLWGDAWRQLRTRPLFLISSALILLVITVAVAPGLFTDQGPRDCDLANTMQGPRAGHPLGFTQLGCDIYARVIYGARPSVLVGVLATLGTVLIGGTVGALAGFFGGRLDSLLSRVADIFFAIPLILGAIVLMQVSEGRTSLTVAMVLTVFGWPQVARIMRGAVLEVRQAEFITASRALGSSSMSTMLRHAIPNALSPVIVIATVSLGIYIATEATLSFLGIGLHPSIVSWGGDISAAQNQLRVAPQVLLYPAAALSLTVLSFIMLGDAVRDALDPKGRKR
ncbi:oligopeptide transport system permease protein [Kineococcus xinjiangensis]|uniref:Oligopeptide transport system permease protein n=1 Tax=Kineococcus xinjiangensis TaxID=512762 RepID=A0A2S6IWW8_9ACTN|nr:ABC transporter permease [Kineococcus xinjiangensis]PPK98823.1 oligopeptide transport system permease protein [Kineococcus xinjiangensis]